MLNKVSVFDIIASFVRRLKTILAFMIAFAVIMGGVKYYRNKGVSVAAQQKLTESETALKTADSDYSNYNDRMKSLPLFEINAKSTWLVTAIYHISAAELSDEEIDKYCKDLKLQWEVADLSKSLTDLYNKNPDDEAAREVIELAVTDEQNIVLTVKAKNKPQGISVYYMINNLLSDIFDDLNKSKGYKGKLVQSKLTVKKTNDNAISQKQEEMKEELQQLETLKRERQAEYDNISVNANRLRGVKKWALAGAAMVLLLSAAIIVCFACIYEPALSASFVTQETELDYIGTAAQKITLIDRIASIISKEKVKRASTENDKVVEAIKKNTGSKRIDFISVDECAKSKALETIQSLLSEAGYETEIKTEDSAFSEKAQDTTAVIVIRKDKTLIKEIKQFRDKAEDTGYKTEGFIFS